MSEIKLRAKRKNTDDWLLFGITELFHSENGYFRVCVEDVGLFAIDPATIQLAADPRKAMLDKQFIEGAEAFRRMLLKSCSPFLWPHIEGVFSVFAAEHSFEPRAAIDETEAKL